MSKLSPSNPERAARAKAAIFRYAKPTNRGDLECAVIDLLSDLAHFCDRERLNLAQLIDTARGHYNTETEGEGVAFSDPYCDRCDRHHVGGHDAPECRRARALDAAHAQYIADSKEPDGGRTRMGNTPDGCAFCGKSAESCICDEQPLEEGE